MIALLLGHFPTDPGAVADVDLDGDLDQERDLARRYMLAAATELRALGVDVLIIEDGTYSDRLRAAERAGSDLVVWCHLNAGGGGYGLVLVDARSPAASLSRRWAGSYRAAGDLAIPVAPVQVRDLHDGDRGYTLMRSRLPVVVLEPLFLDRRAHQEIIARGGLLQVAACVVRATTETQT